MKYGFQLNERQTEVLERWIKTLDQQALDEACEEDCVVTSPLTFTYWATGLGDHIEVECLEQKLNLTIDDDNEGAWPESLGRKYA